MSVYVFMCVLNCVRVCVLCSQGTCRVVNEGEIESEREQSGNETKQLRPGGEKREEDFDG